MIEKRITKIKSNKNKLATKYRKNEDDFGYAQGSGTVSFDQFKLRRKFTHMSIVEVIS